MDGLVSVDAATSLYAEYSGRLAGNQASVDTARMGQRLGQHFLTAPWAASALAHAAGIRKTDVVLEIGPGNGALTRALLTFGACVIAIEKDESLIEKLRAAFPAQMESGQLCLIAADIRDISPRDMGLTEGEYVLAANIPYYITGEIIRQFLTNACPPRTMALLVQKEVADRIVSSKESILSLSVKAYGTPRIVKKVPRGNFSPPPAVDSAIISIDSISKDFFSDVTEDRFFKTVRAGFASKRKFAVNNVASIAEKSAVSLAFEGCGIPQKSRAEDIPLAKWKCLTMQLLASRV